MSSYTIAELTKSQPTQLNSPPTPTITEPTYPPDVLSLLADLRSLVIQSLTTPLRFTPSYQLHPCPPSTGATPTRPTGT